MAIYFRSNKAIHYINTIEHNKYYIKLNVSFSGCYTIIYIKSAKYEYTKWRRQDFTRTSIQAF